MKYFKEFHNHSKLPTNAISTITDFHSFSTEKIAVVKSILKDKLQSVKCDGECCVVAVGSYGRFEASELSDLDVYLIHSAKLHSATKKKINRIICESAKEAQIRCSGGFESISLDIMHKNIGGKKDDNSSITNRILFLLESECLYNKAFYKKAYEKILRKYLKEVIDSDHKSPRFLISDIIRYYRTICVDYEFKTVETNKEWAIRNIKLRFSRKGLYFGGIIILLNSLNKSSSDRYNYIKTSLSLPFADKVSHIMLDQKVADGYKDILVLYANFMREISKEHISKEFKTLKKANKEDSKPFCNLTDMSKEFNNHLLSLLNKGTWGDKDYLDFLVL